MDIDDQPTSKRTRGRPRSDTKGQVIEKLLEATELFLRDNSHFDLTERKIASVAGVNDAMINYYFGGKDKLLFEIITHQMNELERKLRVLDTIKLESKSITRDIFKILINTYYDKPWIAKFAVSEFGRRGSAINALYVKKYGAQGSGLVYFRRVISRLIEVGIYDRRINVEYAAKSMLFIVIGPLNFPQVSDDSSIAFDEFRKDSWIDYIADMFDCQFRVAEAK